MARQLDPLRDIVTGFEAKIGRRGFILASLAAKTMASDADAAGQPDSRTAGQPDSRAESFYLTVCQISTPTHVRTPRPIWP